MVSPANWKRFLWNLKESSLDMIIALMESLEGGADLVSHSQTSNSFKLSQQEAREQSITSLVV
jgi:threonine synthase